MTPETRERLVAELRRDEGVRLRPYKDSLGVLTIGVGRNLDAKGLSSAEVAFLLANDMDDAERGCRTFPWYETLDEPRQAVIFTLVFNIGLGRFVAKNPAMLRAMAAGDYERATAELMNGPWHLQVKARRANRLAEQLRSGLWPTP